MLILENAAVLLWGILFETKCVLISCHHQKLRLQNFLSFFLGFGVFRLQVLISDVLIKKLSVTLWKRILIEPSSFWSKNQFII